ncbi:hypothetical protein HPB48_019113 [Haemaphysalis longicornis]|uniref:Uncharacterized protein n=1 Tax=Haemaphysalis longicornis TaxID=44386 RepID=A0A9J6GB00_HAELO|nr:hypothetical protein HPB48_019113 [Haemaphysalis longicornis]
MDANDAQLGHGSTAQAAPTPVAAPRWMSRSTGFAIGAAAGDSSTAADKRPLGAAPASTARTAPPPNALLPRGTPLSKAAPKRTIDIVIEVPKDVGKAIQDRSTARRRHGELSPGAPPGQPGLITPFAKHPEVAHTSVDVGDLSVSATVDCSVPRRRRESSLLRSISTTVDAMLGRIYRKAQHAPPLGDEEAAVGVAGRQTGSGSHEVSVEVHLSSEMRPGRPPPLASEPVTLTDEGKSRKKGRRQKTAAKSLRLRKRLPKDQLMFPMKRKPGAGNLRSRPGKWKRKLLKKDHGGKGSEKEPETKRTRRLSEGSPEEKTLASPAEEEEVERRRRPSVAKADKTVSPEEIAETKRQRRPSMVSKEDRSASRVEDTEAKGRRRHSDARADDQTVSPEETAELKRSRRPSLVSPEDKDVSSVQKADAKRQRRPSMVSKDKAASRVKDKKAKRGRRPSRVKPEGKDTSAVEEAEAKGKRRPSVASTEDKTASPEEKAATKRRRRPSRASAEDKAASSAEETGAKSRRRSSRVSPEDKEASVGEDTEAKRGRRPSTVSKKDKTGSREAKHRRPASKVKPDKDASVVQKAEARSSKRPSMESQEHMTASVEEVALKLNEVLFSHSDAEIAEKPLQWPRRSLLKQRASAADLGEVEALELTPSGGAKIQAEDSTSPESPEKRTEQIAEPVATDVDTRPHKKRSTSKHIAKRKPSLLPEAKRDFSAEGTGTERDGQSSDVVPSPNATKNERERESEPLRKTKITKELETGHAKKGPKTKTAKKSEKKGKKSPLPGKDQKSTEFLASEMRTETSEKGSKAKKAAEKKSGKKKKSEITGEDADSQKRHSDKNHGKMSSEKKKPAQSRRKSVTDGSVTETSTTHSRVKAAPVSKREGAKTGKRTKSQPGKKSSLPRKEASQKHGEDASGLSPITSDEKDADTKDLGGKLGAEVADEKATNDPGYEDALQGKAMDQLDAEAGLGELSPNEGLTQGSATQSKKGSFEKGVVQAELPGRREDEAPPEKGKSAKKRQKSGKGKKLDKPAGKSEGTASYRKKPAKRKPEGKLGEDSQVTRAGSERALPPTGIASPEEESWLASMDHRQKKLESFGALSNKKGKAKKKADIRRKDSLAVPRLLELKEKARAKKLHEMPLNESLAQDDGDDTAKGTEPSVVTDTGERLYLGKSGGRKVRQKRDGRRKSMAAGGTAEMGAWPPGSQEAAAFASEATSKPTRDIPGQFVGRYSKTGADAFGPDTGGDMNAGDEYGPEPPPWYRPPHPPGYTAGQPPAMWLAGPQGQGVPLPPDADRRMPRRIRRKRSVKPRRDSYAAGETASPNFSRIKLNPKGPEVETERPWSPAMPPPELTQRLEGVSPEGSEPEKTDTGPQVGSQVSRRPSLASPAQPSEAAIKRRPSLATGKSERRKSLGERRGSVIASLLSNVASRITGSRRSSQAALSPHETSEVTSGRAPPTQKGDRLADSKSKKSRRPTLKPPPGDFTVEEMLLQIEQRNLEKKAVRKKRKRGVRKKKGAVKKEADTQTSLPFVEPDIPDVMLEGGDRRPCNFFFAVGLNRAVRGAMSSDDSLISQAKRPRLSSFPSTDDPARGHISSMAVSPPGEADEVETSPTGNTTVDNTARVEGSQKPVRTPSASPAFGWTAKLDKPSGGLAGDTIGDTLPFEEQYFTHTEQEAYSAEYPPPDVKTKDKLGISTQGTTSRRAEPKDRHKGRRKGKNNERIQGGLSVIREVNTGERTQRPRQGPEISKEFEAQRRQVHRAAEHQQKESLSQRSRSRRAKNRASRSRESGSRSDQASQGRNLSSESRLSGDDMSTTEITGYDSRMSEKSARKRRKSGKRRSEKTSGKRQRSRGSHSSNQRSDLSSISETSQRVLEPRSTSSMSESVSPSHHKRHASSRERRRRTKKRRSGGRASRERRKARRGRRTRSPVNGTSRRQAVVTVTSAYRRTEDSSHAQGIMWCSLLFLAASLIALLVLGSSVIYFALKTSPAPRVQHTRTKAKTPTFPQPLLVKVAVGASTPFRPVSGGVSYCDTDFCSREAHYIASVLQSDDRSCDDFYEYACSKWLRQRSMEAGEGELVLSQSTILEDSLAFQLLAFISNATEPDVRTAANLYSACVLSNGSVLTAEVEAVVRTMFHSWEIGQWPRTSAEGVSDLSVWQFAAELARDLDLATLFQVTVGADPDGTDAALLELDAAQPLLNAADEGFDQLVKSAVGETVARIGVSGALDSDDFAERLVNVSAALHSASIPSEAEENVTVLRGEDLGVGVRHFVDTLLVNVRGTVSSRTLKVAVKSPKYVQADLENTLLSVSALDTLNYMAFLVLVRVAPFLPDDLRSLRALFARNFNGRTVSGGDNRLCLWLVEHTFPGCFAKAWHRLLQQRGQEAVLRQWLSYLQSSFLAHVTDFPWMGNLSSMIIRYHFNGRVITLFDPFASGRSCAPVTSHGASGPPLAYYLNVSGHRTSWRLRGLLGNRRLLRQRGGGDVRSELRSVVTYDRPLRLVHVPAALFNLSVPTNTSFAFHLARVAVRFYRAMLQEAALTYEARHRLDELVDCFGRDMQGSPRSLRDAWTPPYDGRQSAGKVLLDQNMALLLALRTFQDVLRRRRSWESDYRFRDLPDKSAQQLFFVYFALDNCESTPAAFHRRSGVPAKVRVNLALRHTRQFSRAFGCSLADPMALSAADSCDVLRRNVK